MTTSSSPPVCDLATVYRAYIHAINTRSPLTPYVHASVIHNGISHSVASYVSDLIANAFAAAPDLHFHIDQLVISPSLLGEAAGEGNGTVAARLLFDCTPLEGEEFIGLKGTGKRVKFAEHVFYRFAEGKIAQVWSLVDREAVREQLGL